MKKISIYAKIAKKMLAADQAINAYKTSFACILGLILIHLFNIPNAQWVIITVVVVMSAQINLGSTLQKSYMRLLGTIMGAALAAITLYLFGTSPVAGYFTIILACLIFTYMAGLTSNFSQAGSLGAVTVVIILMSPQASLFSAAIRTGEILLGILLALLVSNFIFPIHAKKKLKIHMANTIRKLRSYYHAALAHQTKQSLILEEELMEAFAEQKKLINEAVVEPMVGRHKSKFKKILLCEKHLFREISIMQNYLSDKKGISNSLAKIHPIIEDALEKIAIMVESEQVLDLNLIEFSTKPRRNEDSFMIFFIQLIIQEIENLMELIKIK